MTSPYAHDRAKRLEQEQRASLVTGASMPPDQTIQAPSPIPPHWSLHEQPSAHPAEENRQTYDPSWEQIGGITQAGRNTQNSNSAHQGGHAHQQNINYNTQPSITWQANPQFNQSSNQITLPATSDVNAQFASQSPSGSGTTAPIFPMQTLPETPDHDRPPQIGDEVHVLSYEHNDLTGGVMYQVTEVHPNIGYSVRPYADLVITGDRVVRAPIPMAGPVSVCQPRVHTRNGQAFVKIEDVDVGFITKRYVIGGERRYDVQSVSGTNYTGLSDSEIACWTQNNMFVDLPQFQSPHPRQTT